ncbi:MAG TPA: phosphoribosyltransferase family protein, partial [Polyangiaceae bacterium]|nr:phosphoribosyltransferase family protein [Polyangiaceae bacterium]
QLTQQQRATNVIGAFRVRHPPPATVVLVDDVVTTGATLAACQQVLHAQGSHVIAVVALAYAE